ncbi:MAG: hypothetical protein JRE24_03380, partial [Deltaproteobacteria bacterium]|nr:hypothetical protein [Deltaproteobacteria bacterium]
ANNQYAAARCRPEAEADNRVVAEGEDGYFSGTTGLPVGLHFAFRISSFELWGPDIYDPSLQYSITPAPQLGRRP